MTAPKTNEILQFGALEASVAAELATRYQPLRLPVDADRAAFLAEHGSSIRASG